MEEEQYLKRNVAVTEPFFFFSNDHLTLLLDLHYF